MNRILILIAVAIPGPFAGAQQVMGSVAHDVTGNPIGGALVSAYSSRGDTVPLMLSTSSGRFVVRLPVGREYTLLVRSIGLEPLRIPVGPLAAGQDTTVVLRMRPVQITLATVRVEEFTDCGREDVGTTRVSQVWNEVVNNLESSAASERLARRRFDWTIYERQIDIRNGTMLTSNNHTVSSVTTRPFRTATVRDLSRNGFVLRGRLLTFRVPDENVLRDSSFLDRHCFWVANGAGDRAGKIGLNFVPLSRSTLNDIAGTFWIDSTSYELNDVEFRYTQVLVVTGRRGQATDSLQSATRARMNVDSLAPGVAPSLRTPGGQLTFTRLPDGTMLVSRWRLWATDNWPALDLGGPIPTPTVLSESGGDILRIGPPRSP